MLCPEVWKFPPPKVIELKKRNQDLESVRKFVSRNDFYKSLIVVCPDETQPPSFIQEAITEDTDYYKLLNCPLTEFVEPIFIESFIKSGKIYCLSTNRNCITHNCVAIGPDGVLTLHILKNIYQTLGLEGTQRPHNYYEVKIDLKNIKNHSKVKSRLSKLELFDFHLIWEPYNEDICPSSIAKYFNNQDITVSVHSLSVKNISSNITEVPALKDVDIDEVVEWIGVVAHEGDLIQTAPYISGYSQPDSDNSMKTTRISVYIVKGFITSTLICKLCDKMNEFSLSREMDNYWSSLSLQSDENSP